MQGRMKQHQLTADEISDVLAKAKVGRIATINENGYPYVVPVHFVCLADKIYIHGLRKGLKISNLEKNDKIGFEVDEMHGLLVDQEKVCDTNTAYRSVIILGTAKTIDETTIKTEVLKAVVQKFTPNLAHLEFPEKMLKATGIIEIKIQECTGKYYK